MQLEIVHDTRYAYGTAVSVAHHLAHLRPLSDARQQLLSHRVDVDPPVEAGDDGREAEDVFGNGCRWFSRAQPHDHLHVRATSRVRTHRPFAGLDVRTSPPWEAVAASLRYVAGATYEPAVQFAMPSPFVPRLAVLREYAVPSFGAGRPLAAGAVDLMHRIHADFTYRSRSTQIDTPLATAFAQRTGVCQDFAHLMAGAMRMLGLPVRYVSGYLLTTAPDGGARRIGADASHAWVQVWCPGTAGVGDDGWLDLDPTNDLVPDEGHVRLAVGRDFGDVTPLHGVIRGGGRHRLTVAVATRTVGGGADVAGAAREGPR